jgi:hypothetical protein
VRASRAARAATADLTRQRWRNLDQTPRIVDRKDISGSTWNTIWSKALAESALEAVDAPAFERYGENFDGRSAWATSKCGFPAKS